MWIWVWPCWGIRTTWAAPCMQGKRGWVGWVTYPALPAGGACSCTCIRHCLPTPAQRTMRTSVKSSRLLFFQRTHKHGRLQSVVPRTAPATTCPPPPPPAAPRHQNLSHEIWGSGGGSGPDSATRRASTTQVPDSSCELQAGVEGQLRG